MILYFKNRKCCIALVKKSIKESFYEKRKKIINILIIFFIFNKNDVKIFIKWIVNEFP